MKHLTLSITTASLLLVSADGLNAQRLTLEMRGAGAMPTQEHPLNDASRILYRLEGGGTYKHVEIEDTGGDMIADSGHGLGFEVGAGAVVPLGQSWRLSPVVRYRSISPEFTIDGVTTSGELNYLALELGLAYRFGSPVATRTSTSMR
jgi:hypothetical protein